MCYILQIVCDKTKQHSIVVSKEGAYFLHCVGTHSETWIKAIHICSSSKGKVIAYKKGNIFSKFCFPYIWIICRIGLWNVMWYTVPILTWCRYVCLKMKLWSVTKYQNAQKQTKTDQTGLLFQSLSISGHINFLFKQMNSFYLKFQHHQPLNCRIIIINQTKHLKYHRVTSMTSGTLTLTLPYFWFHPNHTLNVIPSRTLP